MRASARARKRIRALVAGGGAALVLLAALTWLNLHAQLDAVDAVWLAQGTLRVEINWPAGGGGWRGHPLEVRASGFRGLTTGGNLELGAVPLGSAGAGLLALAVLTPRRRLRPGICRNCGYLLVGLPPGALCPECGGKT